MGTVLNFVNDCSEGTFCQKLRNYLFWLDLATFGVDAVTERMLRQSAREALEESKNAKASKEITDELKRMAGSGGQELDEFAEEWKELFRKIDPKYDRQGGRLLTERELNALKKHLQGKYGVRLRFVDKDYALTGKFRDWEKRNVFGSFDLQTQTLYLRLKRPPS